MPLIEQLLHELEPRARQRGLTLRLMPSGQPEPVVKGDPFLLHQALGNLLENAIDFAPAASTVDVSVAHGSDPAEKIAVRVTDHGPGIPDYALPRLFERFYSLPRPGGQDKSTGLGLCFVREIATLHHGEITLANRAEGGACATLALPAA